MKIDRDTIIDLMRKQAGGGRADQAAVALPEQVDPVRDRGLLAKYGIDADDLLAKLPASITDKIDNLPGGLGKKLGDLL